MISPNNNPSAEPAAETFAVVAQFDDVGSVLHAAEKVRDAGFSRWDVHAPFPIHGIDKAMGIKATRLPFLVLCCGITGFFTGLSLTYWTNAAPYLGWLWPMFEGYPFMISGKPTWSFAAHIPVMFELTVLFSAFGAVFGMFLFNGLPRLYNPLFKLPRFKAATDDKFMVVVLASDPKFDRTKTSSFLKSLGATAVEEVEE